MNRQRVSTRPTAESSLPPAGRNTPAARAYRNAARDLAPDPEPSPTMQARRRPNRADRRRAGTRSGYADSLSTRRPHPVAALAPHAAGIPFRKNRRAAARREVSA